MKWMIWIPVIVLGLLWWMRRSKNAEKRPNR
jgi:hypothetical protein